LDAAKQFFGPGETAAMDRLERETANVRAALSWLGEYDIERAAHLTYGIWYFWGVRGHYREGLEWVRRLDKVRAGLQPQTVAKLDLASGFLHWALGEYERATRDFETGLNVFRELNDRESIAISLFGLGSVHRDVGTSDSAERQLTAALTLFEELDHRAWMGFCLSLLGAVYRQQERYDDATVVLERGLAITSAIGFPGGMTPIVDHLGDIAREQGDLRRALDYYRQTLPVWLQQRDPHGAADSLAGFAATLQGLGDFEGATYLLSAAAAVYEALGFSRSRYGPAYKEEILILLEKQLGAARFKEFWAKGQGLSLEQALTAALDYQPITIDPVAAMQPVTPDGIARFGLTPREIEIVGHLLEGRSNAEIGETLSISPRTAGTHIANIYGKVGVSSRSALVGVMMRTVPQDPSKTM
jgi:non-specific serine/threonine protein kinase